MAMYVYSTEGEPVGFVFEMNIYDCDGTPLGRIVGCRVHRFDGTYVGEWFRDMVVRRPQGRPRMIPPVPVNSPLVATPAIAWFVCQVIWL